MHQHSGAASLADYPSLRGRSVFITGGATGIGAAMVMAFAGQGARVAFVDIQDEPAQALVLFMHLHSSVDFHPT